MSSEWVTTRPYLLPVYFSGGFGLEQKQQDTLMLKSRIDLDPLRAGVFTHNGYAGLDLQQIDAAFRRPHDAIAYQRTYDSTGAYLDTNKSLWQDVYKRQSPYRDFAPRRLHGPHRGWITRPAIPRVHARRSRYRAPHIASSAGISNR